MKSLFKIPQKVHHGVLIVTSLAASFTSGNPLTLTEIARRENVSQGFLEEIAASLRTAKIIKGRRGAGGGYVLTVNPEELTVAQIIEAIEGPIAMTDCLGTEVNCQLLKHFGAQNIWYILQEQINTTLSKTTVADMVRTLPQKTYA